MVNTSFEYRKAIEENSVCLTKCTILLKDGTLIDIDGNGSQLELNGTVISDGVSASGSFNIGSAIANKLTLRLNNRYDEFSDYDFTDAVITVWVGKQLSDHIEWLKKGVFNAEDPTSVSGVISLEFLDNMRKFDVAYDGNLPFPNSLQGIVQYCCTQCGVQLLNGQFPNYGYMINANPFTGNNGVNYRVIISYCALLAGCYARCDTDGRLEFKWYDTHAFDDMVDGGVFDNTDAELYQTGDNIDGGNFTNYTSGDDVDGGDFRSVSPYHIIYKLSSCQVFTDDVVISGIRVKASDSQADGSGNKTDGETYLCGAEGYILEVSENPLIEFGKAKEVAEYLASRIVGMRFRPLNISCIGDPCWEAGDAIIVVDRKNNEYQSYITNLTYSVGNYASVSCDAKPAARNSSNSYDKFSQIIADIKKDSQNKLDSYTQYANQMNQLAINAMGYYETNEIADDGSVINYMHDKPLLSESTIIYKRTIDGTFISRDGGVTYTFGVDSAGNAVMNVIAAIGLYADWIVAGKISSKNGNVYFDLDNDELACSRIVDKSNIIIDNKPYPTVIAEIQNALTGTSKYNYGLNVYKNGYEEYGILLIPRTSNYEGGTVVYPEIMGRKGLRLSGGTGSYPCIQFFKNADTGAGELYILKNSSDLAMSFGKNGIGMGIPGETVGINCATTIGGVLTLMNGLVTHGSKSRMVDTKEYSERLLYCYETPTPLFGDIGEAVIGSDGLCYIDVEPIFYETIEDNYHVFLQKYGPGDLWVSERTPAFFIVEGTPGLNFSWELKATQKDYTMNRLDELDDLNIEEFDYGADAEAYIEAVERSYYE